MDSAKFLKQSGSARRWIVFVGVFLMCMSAMGLGSNSFGLFTVPITEALGMARSTYNLFETVSKVVGMVGAAVFSTVYKKMGPKAAVLLAGGGYVVQYVLFAFAKSLPLILVGGFFAGIGYTFAAQMTVFAVIPPWFNKASGTMTSILSATGTLGASVWAILLEWCLSNLGYQKALIISAIIIAVMCGVGSLLVSASPTDPLYGENAGGESAEEDANAVQPLTNKELLKLPQQWLLIVIYFIVAAVGHPVTANLAVFADAKGFAAATGAAAYAICYAVMTPAKIGVGIVKDKFGTRVAMPIVFGVFVLVCLGIALPIPESLYNVVGFLHGISGTMSQLLVGFIVMETYGKYYHPGQLGLCLVLFNVGRAIGMPGVHLEYDATGHYTYTMILFAVLGVILIVLSFLAMGIGKKWQAKRDAELGVSES